MDAFLRDLRYSVRSLRRQPGFTLVTVITLALGIGANTAVFSALNGVVLRPLAYPDADRLMFMTSQFPGLGFDKFWVSPPEFLEYRDWNGAFQSVGAYTVGAVNLGTDPPSRPVRALVTPELLPTLGVGPSMGRWFTEADSVPNAPAVTVLSWELWQRDYGGRAGVVNESVQINYVPTQIVGIMPRGFDLHDEKIELWEPLTIDRATIRRGNHYLYVVGRLKPDASLASARADLEVLLKQWREKVGDTHVPTTDGHRLQIHPLKDDIVGPVSRAMLVLQAAVGLILLIACANLANLLIARADSRMLEYSVRSALGASRGRLFRQLITEGLLLAAAAAVVGTGLAVGGLRLLLTTSPNAIPRSSEIGLDWLVLAVTLAATLLTGLVFGLVPLAHLAHARIGASLKDAVGRATAGVTRTRARSALVIAEIALAMLLVVGAGLLIRSFMNLTRVDVGFPRAELSTFSVVTPAPRYNAASRVEFYQRLLERVRALPGVQSVAAMSGLPPLRNVNANDTDFEHIPNAPPNTPNPQGPPQNVDYYQNVSVGYPETMGIPVIEGRTFSQSDVSGPFVAMVNETLARRYFTDRSPLGQRVKPGFRDDLPWFTIVGVLKDVKQGGIAGKTGTEIYFLIDQLPKAQTGTPGAMNIVARASVPLEQIAPGFRRAVTDLDPTIPLLRLRLMEDVIDESVSRPRFIALLLSIFAGLALALAGVGTYGVLAYLVTERRQEIGIRMALGADRASILRLVLSRGLNLACVGLVAGLAAALGLTRLMKTLLFNVAPTDPGTLGAVAALIALVAVAACLVPAWRASRVDPVNVLRT